MSQESAEGQEAGRITVEQLEALNAEIAALVRAGVPLDRGLLGAGQEIHGSLGRFSTVLGQRLRRGESLVAALDAEKQTVPPLYRAVVEAGARSGKLAIALEGLARYLRGYSEARAAIGVALWYPVMVMSLAYVLFLGFVTVIVPRFLAAFDSLTVNTPLPLRWLETVGELAPYWWPVGPILLLLLAVAWWRSGRASDFQTRSWSLVRLFPWMGGMLADYESAGFAELLALLLEHRVPFPLAIKLAADATGDPKLAQGARQVADQVERGLSPTEALRSLPSEVFRPLLNWALGAGPEQGSLVESLKSLVPLYRKRAAFQAEKLQLFLPTLLMIGLGGTATLFYGLTLFLPVTSLLSRISLP